MRKRKRDPTTMKLRRPTKSEQDQKLHQQYKVLPQEWDTFQQSKNSPNHLQLINKSSPLELESCLQQKRSPSKEWTWKVRNDDVGADADVMGERGAAIESCKLKGRRLFEDDSDEVCSECLEMLQESEVSSAYGFENDEMINNEDNKDYERSRRKMNWCLAREIIEREKAEVETKIKWIIVVSLIIIVSFIVGIISMRNKGGCFGEDQVTLVPT